MQGRDYFFDRIKMETFGFWGEGRGRRTKATILNLQERMCYINRVR